MPGRVDGTNKFLFIHKQAAPSDRFKYFTNGKNIFDNKDNKEDLNLTRLAVVGDRINYPGDCGTPAAYLVTVIILFNSVLLTTNV